MEYFINATTRAHCDMGDPNIAKVFEKSYEQLMALEKKGVVKKAWLSGPFTSMHIGIIIEAANHEDAYKFITEMPCWCFMDNALYPVIDVGVAIKGIKKITAKKT